MVELEVKESWAPGLKEAVEKIIIKPIEADVNDALEKLREMEEREEEK